MLFCYTKPRKESNTARMTITVKKIEALEVFNLVPTFSTDVVFHTVAACLERLVWAVFVVRNLSHRMLHTITCNTTQRHTYVVRSLPPACFVLCKRVFKLRWYMRLSYVRICSTTLRQIHTSGKVTYQG